MMEIETHGRYKVHNSIFYPRKMMQIIAKEIRSVAEGYICIIYKLRTLTRINCYNYLLREIIIKYNIVSHVCVFNNMTTINYNNILFWYIWW